jgi:hypothetical protein
MMADEKARRTAVALVHECMRSKMVIKLNVFTGSD